MRKEGKDSVWNKGNAVSFAYAGENVYDCLNAFSSAPIHCTVI